MDAREPANTQAAHTRAPRSDEPTTVEDVYRRYAPFVWRTARRMGVAEEALEDVMHEVFLVVHRRLPDYDGRAAMSTWLYNFTRGVASNERRRRGRAQRRLELVQPKPSPAPDPGDQAERKQAARFVRDFLDTLDEEKRRIFELVEIEGLSVTGAAEIEKINVNTAHSRLRAARKGFQRAVRRRSGGSAQSEVG